MFFSVDVLSHSKFCHSTFFTVLVFFTLTFCCWTMNLLRISMRVPGPLDWWKKRRSKSCATVPFSYKPFTGKDESEIKKRRWNLKKGLSRPECAVFGQVMQAFKNKAWAWEGGWFGTRRRDVLAIDKLGWLDALQGKWIKIDEGFDWKR
jgi:hypothetical protein